MIRFACTFSAVLFTLGLAACGGSGPGAESPGGEGSSEGEARRGDSDASGESASATAEAPRGPDCSDGTCFSCGEGICPKGAYCDQNASGGAACAWLPECSGTPACGCITGVLEDCSCDDSSGAPLVTCQ